MTEPTTEAGRAMLADNAARGPIWPGPMLDYILAIEAEAREGVTLTREPGLDAYDAALAETRALFRDGLRPWLRHKDWCNVKTDDPPDTERCKCGLRVALASEDRP